MEFGLMMVDVGSDEETDEFGVNKTLDESYYLINQWSNYIEGVDVDNVVDEYLNYMENCAYLTAKSGAAQNNLDDECIVLDGDPDKPVAVNDNERDGGNGSDDLCIVGQKGQVACRDFPHSRHLCGNFPFNTTSHDKHCKLCHCYVCDSPAPCIYWGNGVSCSDHCHATDENKVWKSQRKSFKDITTKNTPPQSLPILQHAVAPSIGNPIPVSLQMPAHRPLQQPNTIPSSLFFAPTNNAYLQAQRYGQNLPNLAQRSLTSMQPYSRRSDTDGSALARSIVQSHSKFKRIGAPERSLSSSSMNGAPQAGFNPCQMQLNPTVTMQTHKMLP